MTSNQIFFRPECQGRKFGYARVSTSDQKLDRQLDILTQVGCEKIFEDHGVSGQTNSRPGLDKLLSSLNAGDTLVVYKLDRLGRSVTHLALLLKQFESQNIHFCSLSEGLDTTTSGGRMIFHIFAAIAEFQRELIYENTMNGLAAARKRGRIGGRRFLLSNEDIDRAFILIKNRNRACSDVAKELGVSRITLQRAFKRRGLDWRTR